MFKENNFQVDYEQSQTEEFKNGMLLYFDALMPIYLLYDEESYQVINFNIIIIMNSEFNIFLDRNLNSNLTFYAFFLSESG